MSTYYNCSPQYVQPNSYTYRDHEYESPHEFFPDSQHYAHDRHSSHDFGPYHGDRSYGFSSYEAQNHSSARHYPLSVEPVHTSSAIYGQPRRHDSSYSSSPTTTTASVMSRHGSNGSNSPVVERHSRTSSNADKEAFCTHEDCIDEHGHPTKYFSRKADVARHMKSQHSPPWIDCPKAKCGRKGDHGFTRQDHCTEHLRQYHSADIPKRGGGSSGKGGSKGRHAL